jgi:glycosyltransferase involved in cell wall biosynthesis
VPPGDAQALAAALREVISAPELRADLSAGARAARRHLPSWDEATRRFAAALADLAGNAT